jgi:biopolymer transport protein ExbD
LTGNKKEFVVTMQKNGLVSFNSYPVEKEQLVETVKKALINHEDEPVYVRADKAVSYGKVIEIVDSLKQANVKYVAMSTRPTS